MYALVLHQMALVDGAEVAAGAAVVLLCMLPHVRVQVTLAVGRIVTVVACEGFEVGMSETVMTHV